MKNILSAFAIAALSLAVAGCDVQSNKTSNVDRQRQAAVAAVAAEQTECNECNNIAFKRTTLGKPGLIGYVAFLSDTGTPVSYYTVKGKCTSGSKRLTQSRRVELIPYGPGVRYSNDGNLNDGYLTEVVEGPSEDGTYGSSDQYIYCRTTNDAYVQWNGKYIFQTQPFDLRIPALVIDTSGKAIGQ